MSVTYTYPGIYLTETADMPRTVTPATTSLTAILGLFPRGPIDRAVLVSTLSDFEAQFGGDLAQGMGLATYAVRQFFLNGGTGAWIVRLSTSDSAPATADLSGITITANSPGLWANALAVALQTAPLPVDKPPLNFIVTKGMGTKDNPAPVLETIPNLPADQPAELARLITSASAYVVAKPPSDLQQQSVSPDPAPDSANTGVMLDNGSDGDWGANPSQFQKAVNAQLAAASDSPPPPLLDLIAPQVFNLLCIPDLVWLGLDEQASVIQNAHKYAAARQAFLIVDPPPPEKAEADKPAWATTLITPVNRVGAPGTAFQTLAGDFGRRILTATTYCGALYYPWLIIPDPARSGAQIYVPPSGTVAGIYAATDATRGVWKAPAGVDASLLGVSGLADTTINDVVNGQLNVLGINAIRTFPIYGTVVWGSRTLAGSDLAQSPWKYIPVRRLTDFIEQTLLQSLRWAIFEPNGPALWASISLEVGAFMSGLYSAGAFLGTTAAQAFQVMCDASTTSETDILSGIVRVHVGFQPVEPAEFIVLNIVLNAGAAAS